MCSFLNSLQAPLNFPRGQDGVEGRIWFMWKTPTHALCRSLCLVVYAQHCRADPLSFLLSGRTTLSGFSYKERKLFFLS